MTRHYWSGKHKRVVPGINLLTLLWTDGERYIPIDYRIYDKANDGLTKNDHLRAMLQTAQEQEFEAKCVIFDSWYASLPNLKFIRGCGWRCLTRLVHNRQINPDHKGLVPLNQVDIAEIEMIIHLKGYGLIKVFKLVATDGDIEYWATNDLKINDLTRLKFAELAGVIETYHRGIKQFWGIERCQARSATDQHNHLRLITIVSITDKVNLRIRRPN